MVYRQMSQEPLELLETVRLGLPRLFTLVRSMSKGKKYKTPKRFWNKNPHKKSWKAHVMSSDHKKFKWFFRQKKWFKDNNLQRMSMRFPMSHEIWGWD